MFGSSGSQAIWKSANTTSILTKLKRVTSKIAIYTFALVSAGYLFICAEILIHRPKPLVTWPVQYLTLYQHTWAKLGAWFSSLWQYLRSAIIDLVDQGVNGKLVREATVRVMYGPATTY